MTPDSPLPRAEPIGHGALPWFPGLGATASLAMLFLIAPPIVAGADDESAADDQATITLFDGRSLDGWEKTDFYRPGPVTVEDGALVLEASASPGGMTGVTTTRQDLPKTDYELTYQARRLSGRDFFAAATFPVGDSFLTLVNGGWGGTISGLSSIDGMDASENLTGTFFEYEKGTWYTFRIRVTDDAVRCRVDDEELITLAITGQQFTTRLETRANQPLGFATWQTSGALRSITMRPLTPDEIAANVVPEP